MCALFVKIPGFVEIGFVEFHDNVTPTTVPFTLTEEPATLSPQPTGPVRTCLDCCKSPPLL